MILHAILASLAALPLGSTPQKPQISLRSALRVDGKDVIAVDTHGRSLPQAEFAKIAADPKLFAALSEKHLKNIGTLETTSPIAIGAEFFGAGRHEISLAIDAAGLWLQIGADARPIAVATPPTTATAYIARPTFVIVSSPAGVEFALEVRFAEFDGSLPIRLGSGVVADMNNVAFDLLQRKDATIEHARSALRLARIATEATELREPRVLDTYALALFRTGSIEDAIKFQRIALDLLPPQDPLRGEAEGRLVEFQAAKRG